MDYDLSTGRGGRTPAGQLSAGQLSAGPPRPLDSSPLDHRSVRGQPARAEVAWRFFSGFLPGSVGLGKQGSIEEQRLYLL